jgi:RHS repeat-associated protein
MLERHHDDFAERGRAVRSARVPRTPADSPDIEAAGSRRRYDYFPYGKMLGAMAEAVEQRYGFAGRERAPASRLIHMRARVYEPATGRFLSRDPVPSTPRRVNSYTYATNSPTNLTDASGGCADRPPTPTSGSWQPPSSESSGESPPKPPHPMCPEDMANWCLWRADYPVGPWLLSFEYGDRVPVGSMPATAPSPTGPLPPMMVHGYRSRCACDYYDIYYCKANPDEYCAKYKKREVFNGPSPNWAVIPSRDHRNSCSAYCAKAGCP